jgi:hypothetical protein
MTAQRNRNNNETWGSTEEKQAREQKSLLLSYAKSIGDSNSLLPLPGSRMSLWVMRCPLRVHPGKGRTLLLSPARDHWWCTACAVHGDVVDLAARLNRFDREDAEKVIGMYLDRFLWS